MVRDLDGLLKTLKQAAPPSCRSEEKRSRWDR
jgi:hypothetical protein